MKKQRNIRKKPEQNLQKRRFPAHFRFYRPEKFFSRKTVFNSFSAVLMRIFVHKLQKFNDKISRKSPKNAFFGTFLALVTKNFFFENPAPSHFGYHNFASLCKKSEKTNEPIPRKADNRGTN